ncbi:alpha/beta fold hydrolase [Caenimonas sp. SL110]|uniref:thioesterase domain-containing protein n=1 Tax=Caenimonas sp. SL110 TaxID=1450524 RepID=UPI00069E7CB8|nr:alpha/beta fold hydrolase [Caenimonas sp. SL110]
MTVAGAVTRPGQFKVADEEALCIPIQRGNAGVAPVFCVPGAGASVTAFIPLTSALGNDTPVYGLQPRGLDGKGEPFGDVHEAAQAYLPFLKQVAAHHPLRLVGHSFGGWIAFEIARSLEREGVRLTPPILVDSRAPCAEGVFRGECRGADALAKLVWLLEQSCGRSLGVSLQDFERLAQAERVPALARAMASVGFISPRTDVAVIAALARVFEANVNTRYLPASPLHGPATFVGASDTSSVIPPEDRVDPVAAWRRFAPRLNAALVPGNHMTMLAKPHVAALAKIVRDQAQERGNV